MRRRTVVLARPAARGPMIGPTVAPTSAVRVHASCVELQGVGVLLLGPSGSGKSDLALRLIDAGARLVADDQVAIERRADRLFARPAEPLAGLLEVRGLGIVRLPCCAAAELGLAVQLAPGGALDRLPDPAASYPLLGLALRCVSLDPRAPSACAKIRLALRAERVA
jgi:HPr kinase/phosphorylase